MSRRNQRRRHVRPGDLTADEMRHDLTIKEQMAREYDYWLTFAFNDMMGKLKTMEVVR